MSSVAGAVVTAWVIFEDLLHDRPVEQWQIGLVQDDLKRRLVELVGRDEANRLIERGEQRAEFSRSAHRAK